MIWPAVDMRSRFSASNSLTPRIESKRSNFASYVRGDLAAMFLSVLFFTDELLGPQRRILVPTAKLMLELGRLTYSGSVLWIWTM